MHLDKQGSIVHYYEEINIQHTTEEGTHKKNRKNDIISITMVLNCEEHCICYTSFMVTQTLQLYH